MHVWVFPLLPWACDVKEIKIRTASVHPHPETKNGLSVDHSGVCRPEDTEDKHRYLLATCKKNMFEIKGFA